MVGKQVRGGRHRQGRRQDGHRRGLRAACPSSPSSWAAASGPATTACAGAPTRRASCGCGRMPASRVMGGEQAARVLAQVKRDGIEKAGKCWSAEEEEAFMAPIREQYELQGHPYYASARLWDDGVIDPVETRRVLGAGHLRQPQRTDRADALRRVPHVAWISSRGRIPAWSRSISRPSTSRCASRWRASWRRRSSRVAQAWEEQGYVPREVLRKMGALGCFGITYPPEYGGAGADALTRSCSTKRCRAARSAVSPSRCWCTPTWPRRTWCMPARRRSSRSICPGSSAASSSHAVAITEPDAGSDVKAIRTRARAGRRRLGAERQQDVHHQRRARRSVLRRGAYRPRRAARTAFRCSSSRRAPRVSASAAR